MNKRILLPAGILVITGMLISVMEAAATTGDQREAINTAACPFMIDEESSCIHGSMNAMASAGKELHASSLLNTHAFKSINGIVKDDTRRNTTGAAENQ